MVEAFHWPPLESSPEIFEQYLKQIGYPADWAVGECYGFDDALLEMVPQPCVGVIIATQRLKKEEDKEKGSMDTTHDWYMKQTGTLDNACGIIAAVHAIANNASSITVAPGSVLSQFITDTAGSTPQERATALETNVGFQNIHKSFASQGQSNQATTQDEVNYHFTALVINSAGQLVELDGTKNGPLKIADNCDNLLKGTVTELQRRIAEGEISEQMSMMTINKAM